MHRSISTLFDLYITYVHAYIVLSKKLVFDCWFCSMFCIMLVNHITFPDSSYFK